MPSSKPGSNLRAEPNSVSLPEMRAGRELYDISDFSRFSTYPSFSDEKFAQGCPRNHDRHVRRLIASSHFAFLSRIHPQAHNSHPPHGPKPFSRFTHIQLWIVKFLQKTATSSNTTLLTSAAPYPQTSSPVATSAHFGHRLVFAEVRQFLLHLPLRLPQTSTTPPRSIQFA